jgi:prepilin-type N-terminal cleavage/methylation domain-containing protein
MATLTRRNGFSLIEIMMVMVALVIASVGVAKVVGAYADHVTNQVTAQQLRIAGRAAEKYLNDNAAGVAAIAGPTTPFIASSATLANYMPAGINPVNAFGQNFELRVIEQPAGRLQALVMTIGGEAIPGRQANSIASIAGTAGGRITPENPANMTGGKGMYAVPLAPYGASPGVGHLGYWLAAAAADACVPPAPVVTTGACPAGQTGAITFTNTATCPSSTSVVSWSGPIQTGSTCVAAAADCIVPAGTVRSWTVGSAVCTAATGGTVTSGSSLLFTDAGSPTTGAASYLCTTGALAATPLAGATCVDSTPLCVVPSPSTQTQTLSCAAGQYGAIAQSRSASCPSPTGAVSWTAWSTTSNTCTSCPASTVETRWVSTTDGTCPAGQSGAITREKEQQRTKSYSCPAGTTSLPAASISAWADTGAVRDVSSTCTTTCTAPSPTSSATTRAASSLSGTDADCAAGQFGSHTWSQARTENGTITTSWTCPGPTSSASTAWLGTFNVGAKTVTGGSCTACPASTTSSTTQWVPTTNGTCPVGQTGTVTREKEQAQTSTTSYSCPAGTAALPAPTTFFGTWIDTGVVRDVSNTCVAAVVTCSFQPRTDLWAFFNPKVGGALLCIPYDTQFGCSDGSAAVQVVIGTPEPGPACNVVATPPTPTGGTTVNPLPSRFGTITTGPKKY